VRVLAGARDEFIIDSPGEFLGVGVESEGAFRAVRKFLGLIASAMRGRQYEGNVPAIYSMYLLRPK